MLREEDRIRFRHMLDAAIEARRFIEGRQSKDVAHDRMLALALVKAIEIIGEAASNVSPQGTGGRAQPAMAIYCRHASSPCSHLF